MNNFFSLWKSKHESVIELIIYLIKMISARKKYKEDLHKV